MTHDCQTLEFYDGEAGAYATRSDGLGVSRNLGRFLSLIGKSGTILDLGCGTGRDTRAIFDLGFEVVAVDGSVGVAREAERRTGRAVRVLLFEDLDYVSSFDGIWANASLLHVPRDGLPGVMTLVHRALKPGGWLYASFKSGGREGRDRLGRYYNYLEAGEVEALLRASGEWASVELTTGRGKGYDGTETGWVEVMARKSLAGE